MLCLRHRSDKQTEMINKKPKNEQLKRKFETGDMHRGTSTWLVRAAEERLEQSRVDALGHPLEKVRGEERSEVFIKCLLCTDIALYKGLNPAIPEATAPTVGPVCHPQVTARLRYFPLPRPALGTRNRPTGRQIHGELGRTVIKREAFIPGMNIFPVFKDRKINLSSQKPSDETPRFTKLINV